MTPNEFRTSAEFIAKRNTSKRVGRVTATFNQATRHLTIVYVLDEEPNDDDRDDCELTCAELVAAFPEIRTAETRCVTAGVHLTEDQDYDSSVYQRG